MNENRKGLAIITVGILEKRTAIIGRGQNRRDAGFSLETVEHRSILQWSGDRFFVFFFIPFVVEVNLTE